MVLCYCADAMTVYIRHKPSQVATDKGYPALMSKTRPQLWFPSDTSGLALWDENHPLFEDGAEMRVVETQFGSVNVKIPARLGKTDLANTVAIGAAYFKGGFLRAHRDLPYLYTESVAQSYVRLGGTVERWLTNLADMGITPDPRADNFFVTYLRALDGNRQDPHSRLGRWGRFLDRWVTLWKPGPALRDRSNDGEDFGFPDPLLHGDDLPGQSDFVAWAKHMGGIDKIAARHGKWLRERGCLRCGETIAVTDDIEQRCPNCQRPVHDHNPHEGDIRVSGYRHINVMEAGGTINDADWEECHPEHPDCRSWRVDRWENAEEEWLWADIESGWDTLEDAEAEALGQRRDQRNNYSESIKTNTSGTVVTTVGGATVIPFPGTGDTSIDKESGETSETVPAQQVVNGDAPVSGDGETAPSTGTDLVVSGDAEAAPGAEQTAADADDGEDEVTEPNLRDPPSGCESWEKARIDYEIYSQRDDWGDAPAAIRRWLSGDPEEAEDYFKNLDKIGAENIGTLHALIEEYDGTVIANAFWALADDSRVFSAVKEVADLFLFEQYEVGDIEELKKEHDIFRDANRELHKENEALKDEIARLKGDKK
jgi:hypothetical protein